MTLDIRAELTEKLAAIEHERWSKWHEHAARNWTDSNILRWNALANMPYEELTEELKQKDRDEVMKYWPLIESLCRKVREEALDEAARVAMTEEEPSQNPSDAIRDVVSYDPIQAITAGVRATKKSIEVNILSLKSRNQRSGGSNERSEKA